MQIGRTVTVLSDIDLRPHTTLRAFERGVLVSAEHDEDGECVSVEVSMARHHKGLDYYGNVALLAGPELAQIAKGSLRNYRPYTKAAAALAVVAVLGGGTMYTQAPATARAPPTYSVVSAKLVSDVMEEGGSLTLDILSRTSRVCSMGVERTLLRYDAGGVPTIVWRKHLPGTGAVISEEPFRHFIPVELPNGVKPGSYALTTGLRWDCPNPAHSQGHSYTVRFTVIPKSG